MPNENRKKGPNPEKPSDSGENTTKDKEEARELPPPLSVQVKLNYQPVEEITNSAGYVKYAPPIFEDNMCFDYAIEDYELTMKDREWLKAQKDVDYSNITERNFERIIDCLEKVHFQYKDTQVDKVEGWFFDHADEALKKLVKPQ